MKEIRETLAQEYHWPDSLPPEDVPVAFDPALFDAYVGSYELKPGFTLSILRKNDGLFLHPTDQKMLALHPQTETRYQLRDLDAEIAFARGDQGEITSLTFIQQAKEMVTHKIR